MARSRLAEVTSLVAVTDANTHSIPLINHKYARLYGTSKTLPFNLAMASIAPTRTRPIGTAQLSLEPNTRI